MESWENIELVCISLVQESAVKVVGVANERRFGYCLNGSPDFIFVALGSVEDRRVECLGDVIKCGRLNVGKVDQDEIIVNGVVGDGWVCEVKSFVRIVTNQNIEILVEIALQKQFPWWSRDK